MLTGFVQNIEIFLPVSGGIFPCLSGKEILTRTSCAAFRNSLAHSYHEIRKNNPVSVKAPFVKA